MAPSDTGQGPPSPKAQDKGSRLSPENPRSAPAWLGDALGLSQRETRRFGREALRVVKIVGLLLASAVLIPVVMISLGLLLGPKGYEGLVATPLAVLVCWALILYWGVRRRVTPQRIRRARLAQLPAQVAALLERHRAVLSANSADSLERLFDQLEQIQPTAALLRDEHPLGVQLRKLLAEDLSDLVESYGRLPARLRKQPLHGGPTPEEQLSAGLLTVERQLERLSEQMSREDLFSLATKQRYLEIKYGSGKDEPR